MQPTPQKYVHARPQVAVGIVWSMHFLSVWLPYPQHGSVELSGSIHHVSHSHLLRQKSLNPLEGRIGGATAQPTLLQVLSDA
jgi:hypothetical protein